MKKTTITLKRLAIVLLLIFLDQATKWLAIKNLKNQPTVPIIKGVLELEYVENTGAAFSVLQGKSGLLLIIGMLTLALLVYVYTRIPATKKWNRLRYPLLVLIAGATGNLIDRAMYGYVVDFIYFVPINFPKFNIADSCIVVSLCILFFFLCFRYSSEELNEIQFIKKSGATPNEK